jgi:hypothetical protein
VNRCSTRLDGQGRAAALEWTAGRIGLAKRDCGSIGVQSSVLVVPLSGG